MAINKQEHAQWSSSFGFVLAAVGSAVGLGKKTLGNLQKNLTFGVLSWTKKG